MSYRTTCSLAVFLALFLIGTGTVQGQTSSIYGVISDLDSGDTLPGATILILDAQGTRITGTASGQDGDYELTDLSPGARVIQVSFVGFETISEDFTLVAGQNLEINISMEPTGINLGTVEITSARRRERLMDTPSSVSVMNASEISARTSESPADALRSVKGVNATYTGIGTSKISLRGFNSVFSVDVLFLANDRQTNLAAWSLVLANIAPGRLDIDKIEVIRGPGANLYGGGADVGVVHYATKDPFEKPGTTVSIGAGEREYRSFELRHAGTAGANNRIGYKVNLQHVTAHDWTYDSSDSLDIAVLDRMVDPSFDKEDLTRSQLDAEIGYRWSEEKRLTFNAGTSSLTGVSLAGVGRFFADESQFNYAQIRYRQGRFFAQTYAYQTKNQENSLFLDVDFDRDGAPDRFVDESFLYTAQVQYDYDLNARHNIVVGADGDFQTPRSRGTLFGIYEDEDFTREIGVYAQSRHDISHRLRLHLGLRTDHHSVLDDLYLTPRIAAVFTPMSGHKFRASITRGFAPPNPSQMFQDLTVGPLFGDVQIVSRGRARDIEWERNPDYASIAGSDLVVSSLLPGMTGNRTPAGVPVDVIWGWIYPALSGISPGVLAGALGQNGTIATDQQAAALLAQLSPALTSVDGFSSAVFRTLDPATGQFTDPYVPGTVSARVPRFSTSLEFGYKGLIGNNFIFEIEAYRSQFKNFTGGITNYAPFAFVPDLEGDLTSALAGGMQANGDLTSELADIGMTADEFSSFLVSLAGGSPIGPDTPIGIVQSDQEGAAPEGQSPNWFVHSTQSGTIHFWGVDASFETRPRPDWTLFGSISWISDNIFDADEAGVDDPNWVLSSNTPNIMVNAGVEYDAEPWSLYVAGRHRGESERLEGVDIYTGVVEAFTTFDASVEYEFSSGFDGLSAGIHVRNVLDNVHREYQGGRKIGRFSQLRLTYDLK